MQQCIIVYILKEKIKCITLYLYFKHVEMSYGNQKQNKFNNC